MRYVAFTLVALTALPALAEPTAATYADAETIAPPDEVPAPPHAPPFVLGGYVETFYQWNLNRPDNQITNYRAFDNRSDTFTLSNLALDVQWDVEDVVGRVALQVGHTPSTYYASEPLSPGTSGANESSRELWKYVQQANVGYRFHVGARALLVQAGVFLSPIGPESMVVHENWHWSRSNLFFGLPFYHTGARAVLSLSSAWTLSLAAYNGWNSVVDNNRRKSLALQATYAPSSSTTVGLLYFTGVERPRGAPEGDAFRHLADVHVTHHLNELLSLMGELNAGYEPTDLGASYWVASAGSARVTLHPTVAIAARMDVFYEHVPERRGLRASPLFFGGDWVTSPTLTVDYHPAAHVSFRVEYRHDHARPRLYYRGAVGADQSPDARTQNTLTLGVTAWF